MTFPFSAEALVPKSFDSSQAFWPGDRNDVLPFLVTFKNLGRRLRNAPRDAAMLQYLPHTKNSIYTLFGMSTIKNPDSTQNRGREADFEPSRAPI